MGNSGKQGTVSAQQQRDDGWEPGCRCYEGVDSVDRGDTVPGVVLDPFCGAGTTGLVALQLGRRFIGIDLNPKYCEMARRRMEPVLRQGRIGF